VKSFQLLMLVLLAVIGALLFLQIPEIRRYLKIRAM
jgi:competence protein ComGC